MKTRTIKMSSLAAAALGMVLIARGELINFNADWRFLKADPAGAEKPGFDDGGWERISTPHTYNDVDIPVHEK